MFDEHCVVREHLRQRVRHVEPVPELLHHEGDRGGQLQGEGRRAEHHLLQQAVAQHAHAVEGGVLLLVDVLDGHQRLLDGAALRDEERGQEGRSIPMRPLPSPWGEMGRRRQFVQVFAQQPWVFFGKKLRTMFLPPTPV